MIPSIIQALLEEEKDRCLYIHYTGYDNIARCGPFINCVESDSDLICQELITEEIVSIDKSHFIRYDVEHKDSNYDILVNESPIYQRILSRFDYLKFYQELFQSNTPIQPQHYHMYKEEDLNLQCLKNSLDIEDKDLDIKQHACIDKALTFYIKEYEDFYLMDLIDEHLHRFAFDGFKTAFENDDQDYFDSLVSSIDNLRARETMRDIFNQRTKENSSYALNVHQELQRTAVTIRNIINNINNKAFPTPRSLLYKRPHLSPIKLFSYDDYMYSLYSEYED